jgi:hypothetical protein
VTKLAKLLLLVAVLVVGVGPAAAHRRAFPHARPFSVDFVVALQPKHGSINKLVASLAVTPRYRFESRALRGFAANLTFRETQRLLQDPNVDCVCPDNWSWRTHDVPGTPQATWKALGYGYTNDHHPANRIYYARTPAQVAPWMSRLRARDQYALKHLNYSRYGVLAIFTGYRGAFEVYAVLLSEPNGLAAMIRHSFEPSFPMQRYALIRIRKDSLPWPVKRLYIGEPG